MGLYLKQGEQRNQLQTKIAADLAERLNKRTIETGGVVPPAILDNQHQSSPLLWVWLLLTLLIIVFAGWILFWH